MKKYFFAFAGMLLLVFGLNQTASAQGVADTEQKAVARFISECGNIASGPYQRLEVTNSSSFVCYGGTASSMSIGTTYTWEISIVYSCKNTKDILCLPAPAQVVGSVTSSTCDGSTVVSCTP